MTTQTSRVHRIRTMRPGVAADPSLTSFDTDMDPRKIHPHRRSLYVPILVLVLRLHLHRRLHLHFRRFHRYHFHYLRHRGRRLDPRCR